VAAAASADRDGPTVGGGGGGPIAVGTEGGVRRVANTDRADASGMTAGEQMGQQRAPLAARRHAGVGREGGTPLSGPPPPVRVWAVRAPRPVAPTQRGGVPPRADTRRPPPCRGSAATRRRRRRRRCGRCGRCRPLPPLPAAAAAAGRCRRCRPLPPLPAAAAAAGRCRRRRAAKATART